MATSTESRLGASANGDLAVRVQQLRLDNQLGTGRGSSRGSWLPWVLCGLLALTWVGVGVRWYRSAPPKTEEAPPAAANEELAAYQAAQSKLKAAEEKLRQMQADLGAKKEGVTAEEIKKQREAVAKIKQDMPSAPKAIAPGELVTQLKGTVIPSLQVTVSPRDVAAEITEIYFSEGKRVKQGEKLATLLDHQYANRLKTEEAAVKAAEAQVTRATAGKTASEAMVAKAEAALASAKARVTRAVAIQERATKDFSQAKMQNTTGTIGAQEYQRYEAEKLAADADVVAADADVVAAQRAVDAAQADVKTAIANVNAANADQKAAQARRDEAQRLVENCVVTAPIDGTILTKSADKGALVSPMSFNVAAGICSIADLSKLEVEIDVPERQITRLRKGQACVLQADADPTREYRGVVDRVMPIADDTKNVVKVRIRVYLRKDEEQGTFLKPKMSVTATVKNADFAFDPAIDQAWGDEGKK